MRPREHEAGWHPSNHATDCGAEQNEAAKCFHYVSLVTVPKKQALCVPSWIPLAAKYNSESQTCLPDPGSSTEGMKNTGMS